MNSRMSLSHVRTVACCQHTGLEVLISPNNPVVISCLNIWLNWTGWLIHWLSDSLTNWLSGWKIDEWLAEDRMLSWLIHCSLTAITYLLRNVRSESTQITLYFKQIICSVQLKQENVKTDSVSWKRNGVTINVTVWMDQMSQAAGQKVCYWVWQAYYMFKFHFAFSYSLLSSVVIDRKMDGWVWWIGG